MTDPKFFEITGCNDKTVTRMCETAGCKNTVEEECDDLCYGCEADQSHRNIWGSDIPMSHHKPS